MVFWSDENRPKIRDFWKKFQNRPVWPVVWARKPKIVTHHYQLTLGNPPAKGLEVSWFLGLHIIPPIQHISVNNGSAVYENLAYFSSKIEAPFVKSVSVSTFAQDLMASSCSISHITEKFEDFHCYYMQVSM